MRAGDGAGQRTRAPFRRSFESARADPGELERLLKVGARKAIEVSAPTLAAMYDRMGFARR